MLGQRIVTAAVLLVLLGAALFWLDGGWLYGVFCVVALGAAWEWAGIAGLPSRPERARYTLLIAALLGAAWFAQVEYRLAPLIWMAGVLWWLLSFWLLRGFPASLEIARFGPRARQTAGVAMIVPVPLALSTLVDGAGGLVALGTLFAIVWGADVGAYFAGRAWGRNKLAPSVSPGKSTAGFYGAVAGGALITVLFCALSPLGKLIPLSLAPGVGMLLSLVVISGDLIESVFKRSAEVKDSASLLPGFGGVLDIVDSVMIVAPAIFYTLYALSAFVPPATPVSY